MPLRLIVDIEKILSDHVRGHQDVSALGARVVGKTPDDTGTAWVRVTRLDGSQTDPADHLTEFLVQLDVYAGKTGGKPEANLLARTVRAVLIDMPDYDLSDGVVTATRIVGDLRAPDADFTPARERVILTVEIHAHA